MSNASVRALNPSYVPVLSLRRFAEIRRVPLRHGVAVADFLSDITFALDTCANIQSFTFTSETDILSTFLKSLLSLKHLMELRLAARLTNPQAELLGRITGLRTLTLDYASWNVLDMLPTWTSTLRGTLRVLTLFVRFIAF